ncbi:hypothetical protein KA078_00415 [Candidatus Woesebacteria bacterium]|nr:hypothetical protein [Candidatus Woesebacteria bacterium]
MLNIFGLVAESLIGLLLAVVIIPTVGQFFLKLVRVELPQLVSYIVSWMLGISLISATSFFGALLVGPFFFSVVGWLSVAITIVNIRTTLQTFRALSKYIKKHAALSVFMGIAALITAGTLMGSWLPLEKGIYIQDGQQQDSLWHIALTRQLLISVPPVHPSAADLTVQNYHYFYNILIAVFSRTFYIPITTLYYQVFPLIICLLLAGSVALWAGYPQKKVAAFWAVFLTFFCGSFAYLIPLFLPGHSWHDSSFWVSQTFSMMVNPQLLLSFSGVLAVLLVYKHKPKKVHPLGFTLLLTALVGPLLGIKAYAWIFAVSGVSLYAFFEFVQGKKKVQTIFYFLLFLVLNGGLFLLILGIPKQGAFAFLPLWYLSSMMESPDRLNLPYWRILEDHYRLHHNWLRVAEIQLKELFYFVFGNLGLRSIVWIAPVWAIIQYLRTKKNTLSVHSVVMFVLLVESIALPLIFVQNNGPVWNSIQFFYYGLIFANCLAGVVLYTLFSKTKAVWLKGIYSIVLVAAALPTFITSVPYKYQKHYLIPVQTVAAVQSALSPTQKVIICPEARAVYDTSLISALTGARPILAHPVQVELMYGQIYKENESDIKRIFSSAANTHTAELEQYMKDNEIQTALCLQKNDSIAVDSLIIRSVAQ